MHGVSPAPVRLLDPPLPLPLGARRRGQAQGKHRPRPARHSAGPARRLRPERGGAGRGGPRCRPVRSAPSRGRTRLPAGLEARGPARPARAAGSERAARTPGPGFLLPLRVRARRAVSPPAPPARAAPQAREQPPSEGDAGPRVPAAAVGP